jgi:TPR repeat protein
MAWAWRRKDEAEAARLWGHAAKQGLADAQYSLGACYVHGMGVEKDEAEAARLYGQAAEQGVAAAQNDLGILFASGTGVEKDEAKAAWLWGQAAKQGHVDAVHSLGMSYATPKGVEHDEAKAALLYAHAAKLGHTAAQFSLGCCYALGEEVEADMAQVARLFGQAVEQDNANARWWLRWCYEHGQGTGQDASAASEQYRRAVEGGCTAANASLRLCFEKGRRVPNSDPVKAARLYALAAEGGTSSMTAYDQTMNMLPDNRRAPDVPSPAALARTRYAVNLLNLAARFGHVAAAQQLESLAGRRDVVSTCCVGCGEVRKLNTCSKCCIARFCDRECSARMWPAHKASCKAWRAEAAGSGTAS